TSITSADDAMVREITDKSITLAFILVIAPDIFKSLYNQILIIAGCRLYKDEESELKTHLKEKSIIDIYIRRYNHEKIFMITIDTDLVNKPIKEIQKKISKHVLKHYSKDTKIVYVI
ncbi:MAG: hypothetical protein ACRC4M_05280, partial [Mycoplasma sp.]